MEGYKKIEFNFGNIEDAVRELLNYKEKGILAYGEFNCTMLYSDTVTLDNAYKEITGKTKAECDKAQQEWKENYDREQKEHKEQIPHLSKMWMEKGREILTSDKWDYWDQIVPVRLGDLYRGMELGCCLNIVEILNNNGTLDEAKKEIDSQNHSGMSYGLVRSMVETFSNRGKEFARYVN